MGMTNVVLKLANPARPGKKKAVTFLVDSGAVYSVVPENILKSLGIAPTSEETFFLANGEEIRRKRGNALFFFDAKEGAAPVIFGQKGDASLLGVVTLESLGLALDPIHRRLLPLKLMLA